ncbi:MAG TPA: DUF6077 domain-containing protein [Rubrobacteraceae bacterium]|nr:DUF6077 domain-containing protein [Rubrobacteraceae bacterium]
MILAKFVQSTFTEVSFTSFLGTLFLFMVPGVVLVRWFCEEHLSGLVMVPVSFAISMGIFALLGVPFLVLHQSLELYLWTAGAIVAACLITAVLKPLRGKPTAQTGARSSSYVIWLWICFLLLSIALASVSRMRMPYPYDDIWVYLAWVREFLSADKLALHEPYFGNPIGTSRAQINGWLLEQAAFSTVSGIDPVDLVLRHLAPTLVVMSLLAFYALARVLFKSETAALLAGSLYALGLLIHLGPRGNLVGRIAEDKFIAWFLFLPVGLIFAFLFLESLKLRYLTLFAFSCWAVVAIHPMGLAILGLCTAGFGLFHLALNLRDREAWIRTASLGGALLSVLLAPLLYLLVTGDSLVAVLKSADINSGDPDVLANMVFVRPEWQRVLELGDNYYMVHPVQVLDPAILVAFAVGLPFLFWRLKHSLAAQLLLGMLLVPTVVCFVPPIATFVGDHVIVPGQMWRLAWPVPLAAFLTLGWMVWAMMRYAQIGLNTAVGSCRIGQFLPLMIVCALMVAVAPASTAEAKAIYHTVRGIENSGPCFDPVFGWMQDNIKEESVVLAPDLENTCIPAYSAQANVVSLRGGLLLGVLPALEKRVPDQIEVPRGALDVRSFFSHSTLEEKVRIIQRSEVDYVMVPADSSLDGSLKSQPGFAAMDTPVDAVERYNVYAVNRYRLN